ncbi:tRNA lysidine(34) synthetase TilS [Carnobacteriaceae bacterium zg-ZUI252]|nr:tRNA lysidine(34) synthetase TilS [Carnobacteriaceae bacterium zg-ZUI252]
MIQPFWKDDDTIVVAVSGGVDSVVLLHLLHQQIAPNRLIVAHVNHFMRENAKNDQQFVEALAKSYGVTYETNVTAPNLNSEMDARAFRYQFLQSVVEKYRASYVATAHHRDDFVETVLLHLIRGNGLKSVTGIPKSRAFNDFCTLYRPLLAYTKKQLYAYAKAHQLQFVEDETNAQTHFTRNRLRHTILPLLRQENEKFDEHIVNFATQLNELVNDVNVKAIEDTLDIPTFRLLSDYEKREMIVQWLHTHNVLTNDNVSHILQLTQSTNGQKSLDLGNGKQYIQTYDSATIRDAIPPRQKRETVTVERVGVIDGWQIEVNALRGVAVSKEQLPVSVRSVLPGDRVKIDSGHKKVARLFIDGKIPKDERQEIAVVATKNNEILAILDERFDYLYKSVETDKINGDNQQVFVKIERINRHDS